MITTAQVLLSTMVLRERLHEYNGTEYTYTGLSDITVTQGEDETVYDIKLRDDVKFSDGEPLTADDLIFTYICIFRY